MPEAIVITESNPEPEPSVERVIGQLETETEHLAEEVSEATETAEQAESRSETAIDIASSAAGAAYNAEEAIASLRSELPEMISAAVTLALESEEEEDLPASEVEVVSLPEAEPEPVTSVQAEGSSIRSILSKILHG
jgi:hypothetical protein